MVSTKRGCKCDRCEHLRAYQREYKKSLRDNKAAPELVRDYREKGYPVGDDCVGCGLNEARCALNNNACCERCTHMFGANGRKQICADCNNVFVASHIGPMAKRCPSCAWYHTGGGQRRLA